MTDLEQKAMKIALEALEVLDRRGGLGLDVHEYIRTKIEALRQALAQPKQEPVAWYYRDQNQIWQLAPVEPIGFENKPLYTAPPKREWKGLTDEEITKIVLALAVDHGFNFYSFSSAIEAKLKEKNT